MWSADIAIARSKVRTVRWVLPTETIQELSSSNDCVGTSGWELFSYPPHSPDLVPSDFHLFPHMKTWLATQLFDDDVRAWLKSQTPTLYDDGINKLVYRYDKCLNLYGDYIKK
ncbi:hypothetical protein AVEN_141368-1 [Araneus ventricosus]|uniref:Tc1-like transposase DDE domain-containing protein n=1 Tax=Araneus ventricosus TaxID=182803 RepID=A0A4Y2CZY5_ARAVE|nr:hypothetical protein AVEN_141368-1 [Araneus ventricosus]